MYSPASRRHQEVQKFILGLLDAYVRIHDLRLVLGAPFQMYLEPLKRGRKPDVLFVRKENLGRLRETYLEGPADLVVEVVSGESRLRDYGEVLAEYELGGVGEYWIVDPERNEVRFFQRKGDRLIPIFPDERGGISGGGDPRALGQGGVVARGSPSAGPGRPEGAGSDLIPGYPKASSR